MKKVYVVFSSTSPIGITEEQIKLRAFPFSLANNANEWLYYLYSGTIITWIDERKLFLERYLLASRTYLPKNIFLVYDNSIGKLYMSIVRDSRNYVPIIPTPKLVSSFFSNQGVATCKLGYTMHMGLYFKFDAVIFLKIGSTTTMSSYI